MKHKISIYCERVRKNTQIPFDKKMWRLFNPFYNDAFCDFFNSNQFVNVKYENRKNLSMSPCIKASHFPLREKKFIRTTLDSFVAHRKSLKVLKCWLEKENITAYTFCCDLIKYRIVTHLCEWKSFLWQNRIKSRGLEEEEKLQQNMKEKLFVTICKGFAWK